MSENLKPMDVYGRLCVPFDVAAYCRGHKYTAQAIDLARACREQDAAELALRQAEVRLERANAALDAAVASAKTAMDTSRVV